MVRSILSFILIFFLLLSCSDNSQDIVIPTFKQELQLALDQAIRNNDGKGLSATVIMPDESQHIFVSGISKAGELVTSDMLFSAGSITKMFTAAAILQLVDDGILSLDDTVGKWLPEYQYVDASITIRQLLNHTNGIKDLIDHPEIMPAIFSDPAKTWTMEDAITSYLQEPYFAKGTNWHYSNTGYLLLRMIINEATNDQLAELHRTRLFNPANLQHTYLVPQETVTEPIAQGWLDMDQNGTYDELPFMNSFYTMAGGGIFCTSQDLAKWAKALFADKTVLSQELLNQMLTFHSPCPDEDMVAGYGLGAIQFNPSLFNSEQGWGHAGNPLGYAAICIYLPEYDVCLAVMDNTEEGESMWVINDLLEIITRHLE